MSPTDFYTFDFKNGIFSGLLFGEIHHFDDPELKKLLNLIKKTFVEIKQNIVARVIINCLPEFMIRPRLPLNG